MKNVTTDRRRASSKGTRPGPVTVDASPTLSTAEVLDAAGALLRGQGPAGLTMANLTVRLRSSPDAVAHHFPTVDDIIRTLASAHQQHLADTLPSRSQHDFVGLRNLLLDISTHECADTAGHLALRAGSTPIAQDPVFQLLQNRVHGQLDRRVAAVDGYTLAVVLWTAVHQNPGPAAPSADINRQQDRRLVQEVMVDLLLIGLRSTPLHTRNPASPRRNTVHLVSGGQTIANLERAIKMLAGSTPAE